MSYKNILYEKDGHIVTITLNRPEVHNCLNWETAKELHKAWQTFRDDDDAFVAIMTGAGDEAFCSGWDLKDAAFQKGVLEELRDYDKFRVHIYNNPGPCGYTRRLDIFKPTIAAINGYCFAAGLETALTLDIRIASENAEFGLLERRWNIVLADGGTVRLPLIVGFAKALELVITGRRFDAQEALRIGLVSEVVPQEKLMDRARELAESICELPQGAIRSDKEAIIRGIGRPLEEALRIEAEMAISMLMRGDLFSEGAKAFLDKRKPDWRKYGL
ncbi:MAG: enoyl-CoA hydratase/isomerase family protein [Candidatus Freyrarchaeum guaymaensis]|nr:enoyl-CoA hydratase-related protein [Candidatus Sigynarchaeota archaeon]